MAKNDTPEIPGLLDDLPEEAPQEQIAKILLRNWRTHLANIRTLDKRIEKLIDEAVKQALAQGRKLTSADIGRVFQRHPELRAALDKTMQQLNDDLTATIEQGSRDAWLRANSADDAVVAAMANNNAQLAALLNAGTNKPQNNRALRAFQQREMQGLKLSDRVWRAIEGMKLDMERAIEVALAEGIPAQKLSERVRKLLKEPHRLYRRVRDKDGNLKLSQAAQKYHPGTGVYRSSYKNAMRIARTEVNMAYQTSDSERWSRSWWVKGIRVSLSNNHTSPDSKGRPAALVDICDELAGDYPADFKFTGWHPQCRCYATAITCEYTNIRDYYRRKRAGEDMTGYTPPGTITEPPEQFKRWMADNSDRLARAAQRGTTPYFIANNAKYTGANWKPSNATATTATASTSNSPIIGTEAARIEANRREYKSLKASPSYTDVEFNPHNGGLKARHTGHIIHNKKSDPRFFSPENLTSTDLELSCQSELYESGKKCILLPENIKTTKGNILPALDAQIEGVEMDIRSITVNKGHYGAAIKAKIKQLNNFNSKNNKRADTICLYFHDPAMYTDGCIEKGMEWIMDNFGSHSPLKEIWVVIRGKGLKKINVDK